MDDLCQCPNCGRMHRHLGAGKPPLTREKEITPEMLASPEFEAVWQCIKRWDINVPDAYAGYCGATGNHVRAILDALNASKGNMRDEMR